MATKPKPLLRSDEAGASDKIEATLIPGPGLNPEVQSHEPQAESPGPELNPDVLKLNPNTNANDRLGTLRQYPEPNDLGTALRDIHTPEHAVATLKEKVGLLHTSLSNVGHFSSVAFNDAEQYVADIRWLLGYLRSKV